MQCYAIDRERRTGSYNEMLIKIHMPYWRVLHWLTLSDSVKYSMTKSNSWAFYSAVVHKLTAIIQSRRLTLFRHIMRTDDNAGAKMILLASTPADWSRQPARPHITWLSTVQQDLKQRHLTLPKAADLAQNHPLWRMMLTYGATQSWSCMPETTMRRHSTCIYIRCLLFI